MCCEKMKKKIKDSKGEKPVTLFPLKKNFQKSTQRLTFEMVFRELKTLKNKQIKNTSLFASKKKDPGKKGVNFRDFLFPSFLSRWLLSRIQPTMIGWK